ncbi:MAG: hypothetical protein JO345_37345 [Streptosporangiaceae bacterium]|nr:hypothetical protein [Streptosporangiaceae bacterium]
MTKSRPGSREELGTALGRLTESGTSWLALAPATATASGCGEHVAVVNLTDRRDPPLTLDPFRPAPGCLVQAHADRLTALFEAAFRPPGPVRAALRLALRRVYADQGWDIAASGALPGAAAPPGIPSLADLRRELTAVAADLGGDATMRAQIHGFAEGTLASVWAGPAGFFLAGGHPADVPGLLRRSVLFTVGEVADDGAAAFLAGTLLISVVEHARAAIASPGAVVVAVPGDRRLRRLLADVRASGTQVIHAESAPATRGPGVPGAPAVNGPAVIARRRSAACGPLCRQRPCRGYELHTATTLACADSQVWLRLWAHAVVLAFLTGRPLPRAPARVRRAWLPLDARTRECLLATVIHAAVAERAPALRHSYDPPNLTAVAGSTAIRLLSSPTPAIRRAGPVWVIPQLRWLHETERLLPLGKRQMRAEDIAPPLDYGLAGLPDWPGIRAGDRLDALRRHRWSPAAEVNRHVAATALLGSGQEAILAADLAMAGIGLPQAQRLRYAARILGVGGAGQEPGWLEVVLSWPSRLILPTG